MRKIFKSLLSHGIAVVIGFAIAISLAVYAATQIASTQVTYTGNSQSTVEGALNDLYTKASACSNKVCNRALSLHTETCELTSNYFCSNDGYTTGSTITYGNLNPTWGSLETGDAFDCDVNGDGIYDSNTERFYFVSTKTNGITTDSSIAVLAYYTHTINGEPSTEIASWAPSNNNTNGPTAAKIHLPTESQWSNVQLTQTVRDITDQNNTIKKSEFSYSGYAARLLTYQEVNQGCYDGTTNITSKKGVSSKCKFLMENSRYSIASSNILGSWLETPRGENNSNVYMIASNDRKTSYDYANAATKGVRPAIEVPISKISY